VVARSSDGLDPGAAQFCEHVYPRLVGTLTAHTGQRHVAEELAQDALARACERWDTVHRMASPVGWTYRVAFNLAASRWRRFAAERRALERLPIGVSAVDDTSTNVERVVLRDALARLPQRQRRAVVLRYLSDLSIADTAVALGCEEGTVRSLTSQGISRLRAVLGEDDLAIAIEEVEP
jgi:RNA polymerase sigma-70 factor (sigma-E family)